MAAVMMVASTLLERASEFADALDAARTRDDDVPGDEIDWVDPAEYGLRVVEVFDDGFQVEVAADDLAGSVLVRWSSSNYFWYAE